MHNQKLYITAGNDNFHHNNGGVADSKHKTGLAIDFRLISNSATGTELYPEDNYLVLDEGTNFEATIEDAISFNPAAVSARGYNMRFLIEEVLTQFPNCTFEDDYRNPNVPNHFHIQCSEDDWSGLGLYYIPPTERNPIL